MNRVARLAAAVIALLSAYACDDDETPPSAVAAPSEATRPDRPSLYEICPSFDVPLGPEWRLVDRGLPNLGNGIHGRSMTFLLDQSGTPGHARQIEIFVGIKVLDAYEDLDFTTEDLMVGAVPAVLSNAGAFGTSDDLLVITWTQPGAAVECSNYSAVGTNIDRAELIELVAELSA